MCLYRRKDKTWVNWIMKICNLKCTSNLCSCQGTSANYSDGLELQYNTPWKIWMKFRIRYSLCRKLDNIIKKWSTIYSVHYNLLLRRILNWLFQFPYNCSFNSLETLLLTVVLFAWLPIYKYAQLHEVTNLLQNITLQNLRNIL